MRGKVGGTKNVCLVKEMDQRWADGGPTGARRGPSMSRGGTWMALIVKGEPCKRRGDGAPEFLYPAWFALPTSASAWSEVWCPLHVASWVRCGQVVV